MSAIKRLIGLIVPTSILGLSWFWWKWKNQLFLQGNVENVESSEVDPADTTDNLNVIVESKVDIDEASGNIIVGGNKSSADIVSDNKGSCTLQLEELNVEKSYDNINDIDENIDIVIEDIIESVDIDKYMCSPTLDNTNYEDNECTLLNGEVIDYSSNDEIKGVVVGEENESDVSNAEPSGGRSNSIVSQISVDCDEGLHFGEISPRSNTSSSISCKRLRNQSSCGDSAIVEDYSSDTLSITGSESATKCSESEVSENLVSPQSKTMPEELCCKKTYSKDSGRNFRDWYGDWDGSKERREKPRHWGSLPVSDSDSEGECILKRTAKIGSVSLDKLSIVLNDELSNIKSSENVTLTKGRYSKQSRRRNRKSESSKASKKTGTPKSQAQKKKDSGNKQRRRSNTASPKKDVDKPWRKDGGRKSEMVIEVNERRETVEYEFPDDMCGRLIGKSGRHISEFKEQNGVDICIECELHGKNRVVSITGLCRRIKSAEKLLNEKFHDSLKLVTYPDISELEKNLSPATLPVKSDLSVIVTAVIDVGSFYVQIYQEDVDEKLMELQVDLANCYTTPRQKYIYLEKELPKVGEYSVSFVDGVWCRLRILDVFAETRMVDAFFIDYGGNVNVSVDHIWKMRPDILQTAAQTRLFHLDNVVPLEGEEFSQEANDAFFQFVGGKILQAFVASLENVVSVRLSSFDEESGEVYSVNDQIVLWGLARYESIPDFLETTSSEDAGESLEEENPLQFLEDVQTDNTLQFLQDVEDDTSTPQFKQSILNGNAPQFICAQ